MHPNWWPTIGPIIGLVIINPPLGRGFDNHEPDHPPLCCSLYICTWAWPTLSATADLFQTVADPWSPICQNWFNLCWPLGSWALVLFLLLLRNQFCLLKQILELVIVKLPNHWAGLAILRMHVFVGLADQITKSVNGDLAI